MYTHKHHLVSLLLLAALVLSHPSPTAASSAATAKTTGGGNVVTQLFGSVKDSVVRTVDGTREMWSNHGRCNDIRAKQKDYRENLKKQWEFEDPGLTPQDLKKRLQDVDGGISYDDFVFLGKGLEDRGKLMRCMFLTWRIPQSFPYAFIYFPQMLPSPFAPLPDGSAKETTLEKISRQRSHVVIKTLLAMEQRAKVVPAVAKINIFARDKQQKNLDKMASLGEATAKAISTPGARKAVGAGLVLNSLEDRLYKAEELTRGEKGLTSLANPIIKGLIECIEGPFPLSVVMPVVPTFMARAILCNQLKKIEDADEFLVKQKVDLDSLSTARLLEACNDRLIGGPGYSDEELRQGLADWLDLAVLQPNNRVEQTGEFYNGNLARTALLSYYSMDGTRDARSASYLPRLLFQGQMQHATVEEEVGRKRKR
jgi:hypothetical protein